MDEAPNTVHGRLLEAVHISGYSFERARLELRWLLEEDRWKELGFANGSAFVRSVEDAFSEFRMSVGQRRELVEELSDIASQRAIADALGVDEGTIRGDLRRTPEPDNAEDSAPTVEEPQAPCPPEVQGAGYSAPQNDAIAPNDAVVAISAEEHAARISRSNTFSHVGKLIYAAECLVSERHVDHVAEALLGHPNQFYEMHRYTLATLVSSCETLAVMLPMLRLALLRGETNEKR